MIKPVNLQELGCVDGKIGLYCLSLRDLQKWTVQHSLYSRYILLEIHVSTAIASIRVFMSRLWVLKGPERSVVLNRTLGFGTFFILRGEMELRKMNGWGETCMVSITPLALTFRIPKSSPVPALALPWCGTFTSCRLQRHHCLWEITLANVWHRCCKGWSLPVDLWSLNETCGACNTW